jgi:hypothetical protein
MKNKIQILLLLVIGINEMSYSQTDTLVRKDSCLNNIIETKVLRKGVYRNLQEFQNNKPFYSLNISRYRYDRSSDYYVEIHGGNMIVSDPSKKKYTFSEPTWGFCDGEKIYFRNKSYYGEILLIGHYCLYSPTKNISSSAFNSDLSQSSSNQYTMNILTGEKMICTAENLEKFILADDAELLDQFKREKLKNIMIYQYVKKYNERHPVSF